MSDESGQFDAEIFGLPVRHTPENEGRFTTLDRLADQFLEQLRAGGTADVEEYAAQHPELAEEIHRVFPMIAAMEKWKSRKEPELFQKPPRDLSELSELGGYRLIRRIGEGGMGVVFEAVDRESGRQVAVKVMQWRADNQATARKRFQREARTASDLQHPNIVPVFDYGESEGLCYYAMPLIDGVSLDVVIQRLRERDGVVYADEIRRFQRGAPAAGAPRRGNEAQFDTPLPQNRNPGVASESDVAGRSLRRTSWRRIARIGVQIARALHYAHSRGTVHGDIKPANVLLDAEGIVRITDFGMARPAGEASDEDSPLTAGGTLRYMSAEQLTGVLDPQSDIYSAGLTIYELTTLRPALVGDDRETLLRRITEARPVPPRELNPEIPADLEAVILTAVDRRLDRRYPSADLLAADLLCVANGRSPQAARRGKWFWQRK